MRELLISILSRRDLFTTQSDYELVDGFRLFSQMLTMDDKCHEAMFGIARINYTIKRYEVAESWFVKAYTIGKDMAYRIWLGMTYVKMAETVSPDNQRKAKFTSYAVKNLSRCAQDPEYAVYANFGLLYMAKTVQS